MKTPDEIKKALRKCRDDRCVCDMCAFSDGNVKKWRELMGEAYAYICKLENLNRNSAFPTDELLKKPMSSIHELMAEDVGWISVKDRLPPYNKPVLVYRPTLGIKIYVATYEGFWGDDDDEWYEHWDANGMNARGKVVVTHWMPMPEPPKED